MSFHKLVSANVFTFITDKTLHHKRPLFHLSCVSNLRWQLNIQSQRRSNRIVTLYNTVTVNRLTQQPHEQLTYQSSATQMRTCCCHIVISVLFL